MKPAHVCHQCVRSQPSFDGLWRCPDSGRPIGGHVAERLCPRGKFELGGFGDLVAMVLYRTGVKAIARGVGKLLCRPCRCESRQRRLNKAVPFDRPIKGPSKAV